MLEPTLAAAVTDALGAAAVSAVAVGGGSIHAAARLDLADGRRVFLKHGPAATLEQFQAEAEGLAWLAAPGAVGVPAPLAVLETDAGSGLLLPWVEPGRPGAQGYARLGRELAALHRSGAPCHGYDEGFWAGQQGGESPGLAPAPAPGQSPTAAQRAAPSERRHRRDNFIGSLLQENPARRTWAEFYAEARLLPMVRRVRGAPAALLEAVEQVASRLPGLLGPEEPPSRLHGDLWAGNVLFDGAARPWLVDPAAYGGHREVDLAMMRLFGGFDEATFAAYDEAFPLAPGHRERVALYQLYPLLVHAALFGGGYVAQALAVARRHA